MASSLAAQDRLERVWANYRADKAFDHLRSWKDPELGQLNLVPGEGSLRPLVVFLGEAPGADEDSVARPFVGASGQLIRRLINEELYIQAEECWITNVVKYRPPNNATPSIRDQINSWPYLKAELECLIPRSKVIVPLGGVAWSVFDSTRSISSVEGTMQYGRNGWIIVPMYHPAYILRGPRRLDAYRRRFAVIREAMEMPD
jgi:DNA polymerase